MFVAHRSALLNIRHGIYDALGFRLCALQTNARTKTRRERVLKFLVGLGQWNPDIWCRFDVNAVETFWHYTHDGERPVLDRKCLAQVLPVSVPICIAKDDRGQSGIPESVRFRKNTPQQRLNSQRGEKASRTYLCTNPAGTGWISDRHAPVGISAHIEEAGRPHRTHRESVLP